MVIGKEHYSDNQEQSKLEQDGDSAREQGGHGLPLAACRQQSLHDELIGAMTGRGQESSADNPSPECIRLPEVRTEVEDAKLACTLGHAVNGGPPSENQMKNREQANDCSANVNYGLHHVGPDHRRQSALEGIDQSQCSDNCNRGNFSRSERDGHYDGNGIHAHAFRRGSGHQKQARRQRSQAAAKAALDQRVGSVEIAAKILRQQNKTDDHASHEISQNDLQEGEIGIVGKAGNADDGERAGFGRNNRKRDRPPGNIAVGQKVIAQSPLTLAEAQAEQSDPHEVKRNDREIEFVEFHGSPTRFLKGIQLWIATAAYLREVSSSYISTKGLSPPRHRGAE